MAKGPSVLRTGGYAFKQQGGMELNFVDTDLGLLSGVGATNGVLFLLNGTIPGSGNSNRIGRRIDMKSMEWQFSLVNMTGSNVVNFKYDIVLDKQANGAACAITDIFTSGEPTALRNISNKARFVVLHSGTMDWLIGNDTVTGGALTSLTAKSATVEKGYKKIGVNVQYNTGTAGTIADIQTNALYLVFRCDTPEALKATLSYEIDGSFRVRYLP